jgi:endonuclease YncB( thermonuclease family)
MGGWDKAPEYGGVVTWLGLALSIIGAIVLTVGLVTCSTGAHGLTVAVVAGLPSITDGDTIRFGETRIRFNGIDAPEHGAMCAGSDMGQRSADALTSYVAGRSVSCAVSGQDRYGRDVATCTLNGEDVGAHMVALGWARDWPRYSHGLYQPQERQARAAHVGVWAQDCPGLWGNRNYAPN